MNDNADIDYSVLDIPEILVRLFHPRPEIEWIEKPENSIDLLIPVEGDVVVGGRFQMTDKSAPNLVFFHGNGEIVDDYNDLGHLYNRMGMNFLAVDYRGYGRSTGNPSVTTMMSDCHTVFKFTENWLARNGYKGSLIVMGRSLGSAPALELSRSYKNRMGGLIVESGFAYLGPLLALLGVSTSVMDHLDENRLGNISKIRSWDKPALIIHAEHDHIIPFSDGKALYEVCPSSDKTLLMIPSANHNDIFMKGMPQYMEAVKKLCESARGS
jgi:fermentation-respiration switch protein FrsA (DUF1100 family)